MPLLTAFAFAPVSAATGGTDGLSPSGPPLTPTANTLTSESVLQ